MKATEQYFPVVLFMMLFKAVLPCETVDKKQLKINTIEQHFPSCGTQVYHSGTKRSSF